jgi:hypothetical protein
MNTAQDVVDYLLTATGGGAQDGEHRAVRSAVIHACREVHQTRDWLWYTRSESFRTVQTSTTAYIAPGIQYITVASQEGLVVGRIVAPSNISLYSTTSRVAALLANNVVQVNQSAVSTVPCITKAANTTSGSAVIQCANNTDFDKIEVNAIVSVGSGGTDTSLFAQPLRVIAKNSGASTITLSGNATATTTGTYFNFGLPYTLLAQTFYDLPANVKDIDALMTETVGTMHFYVSPQEWQQLQVNTRGAGEPYYYTIMRSDTSSDRYQIRFVGVPTDGTIVFYTYRYLPDAIRLMGYEPSCRQGTATVSANSTTVTLTGTTLPVDLSNSVIRFGTALTDADPLGALSPFVYERRIVSRTGDTTLTVDSPLPAMTNVKYAISSIIDASPTMYTAILSATEMWYARLAGKDAGSATALFNRDMRLAMENDVVSPLNGRMYMRHYPTPRTMGYHSPIMPDRG